MTLVLVATADRDLASSSKYCTITHCSAMQHISSSWKLKWVESPEFFSWYSQNYEESIFSHSNRNHFLFLVIVNFMTWIIFRNKTNFLNWLYCRWPGWEPRWSDSLRCIRCKGAGVRANIPRWLSDRAASRTSAAIPRSARRIASKNANPFKE